MALRNQPYLPLYVDDFLADEKLSLCSAESTGVYIRLMCLMHKADEYGVILLKQKFKQSSKQVLNFASMFARQMPYQIDVIERSLQELLDENVVILECDRLIQKRMVKDENLSNIRALAGSKGGKKTQTKTNNFAKAKSEANTVIGIVNNNKGVVGGKKTPTFDHAHKAYKCATYLDAKVCDLMPNKKAADEATLQKWADAFDKTNRINGYEWELIGEVLEFSQEDDFWKTNILSGDKFIKQFDKLYAKMRGKK